MILTPIDVLAVLHAIERGEVTVTPDRAPADVWCGDITYTASNGWTLVVFNDCDDWDYLDSASYGGRQWRYGDTQPGSDAVMDYEPPDVAVWGFAT